MDHAYTKPEPPDDPELDAYEDYLNACDKAGDEPLEFEDWQARRGKSAATIDEERAFDRWMERLYR